MATAIPLPEAPRETEPTAEEQALTEEHAEANEALIAETNSTDHVEVFSVEQEVGDPVVEATWSWRRVDAEGDEVTSSDEEFPTDNYALAAAAKSNPGLPIGTYTEPAREVPLPEEAEAKTKTTKAKEESK